MSEVRCNQCGTANVEGSRFCGGCGATLSAQSSMPPRPAATSVPPPPPPPAPAPVHYPTQPQPIYPPKAQTSQSTDNGRAVASIVLGAIGLVFCGVFTSIPGIIVGKMELNAIRDGRSSPANESLAKVGFFISIGVTVIYSLLFIAIVLLGFLPVLIGIIQGN